MASMSKLRPVTVVETPEFLSTTKKLLDDDERGLLIDYLSANPLAGDLIAATGALRKLRWGLEGRGKRGGAKIIYYFHDVNLPLFAISAFAKNAKADLAEADKAIYRALIRSLIDSYATKRSAT